MLKNPWFKVGFSPSKKNWFYLLRWKPFKNEEKCFYFHLLFVLKMFKFLPWLFGHVEKRFGLITKRSLISKFMTSQPDQQGIVIHILPNISQRKGSQTIKFGQLIEYHKSKIFFQRSCKKWARETSFRPLFAF